jgi:class 3 adenylate cyclase/tetratricopeptide (TPR) repeat protein
VSEFAKLLHSYRLRAQHPEHQGRLTQERLGQLIGDYLDDLGFSNVSIHNWETDKARISQSDRNVLIALVQALHQCQGIHTLAEANALLLAGDYRPLNATEAGQLNPAWLAEMPVTPIAPPFPPVAAMRNWMRLQPYLPADLYQAVRAAPREEQDALCLPHLTQLLRRVVTYVPRYVALSLLETPHPPHEQVNGRFLQGTLLFADISGFTALTEKLRQKAGKAGAEKLVELINRFLEAMLRVLFKHDGELIQFGGDALLCLFTAAPSDSMPADDSSPQIALNAVRAAWEMKQVMAAQFAHVELLQEVVALDVKVAQHSGSLFAATVGTAVHLEQFLTGSTVAYTAQAEAVAQRGEIVISAATHDLLAAVITAEPFADGAFYRVTAVPHAETRLLRNTWLEIEARLREAATDVWALVERLDALTPYLLSGILPQLVYNPAAPQLEGQHRQVTVLFANFIGTQDIIAAYGPEQSDKITADLDEYFRLMQEEAEYYGGVINKVDLYDQGDKLMVTFGAPVAHERDGRRAALAALAMQQALRRHSSPVARARLSQRIGLHTGFAFAGNVGAAAQNRHEYTVMGDTVNLAARIMAAAANNQVWVSETLWEQIAGEFSAQSLPPRHMKGVSDPVSLYHLRAARPDAARQRPQRPFHSPLVGREAEMDNLLLHFDNLLFGAGKQLVAITGPGGVGKTRLVAEWRARTEAVTAGTEPALWLSGYGRSYGQRAHGLFIDVLEALLEIVPDDDPPARWWKLLQALGELSAPTAAGYEQQLQNRMAYLGHFLGWDLNQEPGLAERLAQLEGEGRQLQTRLALCDLLQAAARQRPLLLVLEDLHWADPDSLGLLQFVVNRLPDNLPILFCLLFRRQPQFSVWQTWRTLEQEYRAFCHLVELAELPAGDGRTLLQNLLPASQLSADFYARIQQETDGNPLYMEETLHALVAEGALVATDAGWELTRPLDRLQVPATLYQIIQSRIDDLDFSSPGARRVLWLAAVAGTSFSEEALRHLFQESGRPEAEFWQHLRALRNADMVQHARVRVGEQERPGYQFRHGLVQQVAYENMLLRKRQAYHLRLAQWLETTYAADRPRHDDALAYHFDQGQQWDKAFFYHWQAGKRDAGNYANASALTHLQRALALTDDAAPAADAVGQVYYELGKLLVIAGEYEAALAHLQGALTALAQAGGDAARRMQAAVCYDIGRVYENRGGRDNLMTALAWRDRGLALLPPLPVAVRSRLLALGGIVYLRLGDLTQCVAAAQQALEIADQSGASGEMGFAYRLLSLAARHQSQPHAAMAYSRQCSAIFSELGDLINLGREYANQGVFAFEMDEWALAQVAYRQAVDTLEQVGDQYRLAMACCNLADLYAHLGEAATGLPYAVRGLAGFTRIGSLQGVVFAHCVLASLHWRQGALTDARAHLTQAQNVTASHDIALFRPMVGRWSAEVHIAAGEIAEAEADLRLLLAEGEETLADEAEPVARLWGQVLAGKGEWETAVQTLAAHLARVQQAGQRYQTGLAHLALAQVLARRPEQRAAAREQARLAQQIFIGLGARADEAASAVALAAVEG